MTEEVLTKANRINTNIHVLEVLLNYLNTDNYNNHYDEKKIGELLYLLDEYSKNKLKNNIKSILEELLDKAKTGFKSL